MKVIEQEIKSLKNSISEMWNLVRQQLFNAGEAMLMEMVKQARQAARGAP